MLVRNSFFLSSDFSHKLGKSNIDQLFNLSSLISLVLLVTILVVEGIAVAQKTQGKEFTMLIYYMFRAVGWLFGRITTSAYYFHNPSGVFQ